MSWKDQGRQDQGWWGNGTAPGRDTGSDARDRSPAAALADRSRASVLLAQARPDVATDARPANSGGGYVDPDPYRWEGQDPVGTGECVPLVQQATGAPVTREWQQGARVEGNINLLPGTAIATFDSNGHYRGHAAIYLRQDAEGIHVIDQWNNRENGMIKYQHPPSERVIHFDDPQRARVNQGESYHVVE